MPKCYFFICREVSGKRLSILGERRKIDVLPSSCAKGAPAIYRWLIVLSLHVHRHYRTSVNSLERCERQTSGHIE